MANQGEVEITFFDGTSVALRSSLGAAKQVNSVFGSFTAAFRKVQEFDLAAFAIVIGAGLGKSGKEVEQQVYDTGMPTLLGPVTSYLGFLSNGGRSATTDGGAPKTGEA